jgi:hypothetical protein
MVSSVALYHLPVLCTKRKATVSESMGRSCVPCDWCSWRWLRTCDVSVSEDAAVVPSWVILTMLTFDY